MPNKKQVNKKEKQWNNLQNVTLIIPTYNRPHYLTRLLNYYASKQTPIRFLILDSSDTQSKTSNEQAVAALGDKARYVNFPSTIPVAAKLFEGLKLVETPYCAFCADDDLVFIDGLLQALTTLQSNPDYVCVDGIYLNFNQVQNNVHLRIEYATKGIGAEDPGARVFKLYQKYESLFYGVFRTKNALDIFSGVSKNPSLHYQELFQATSALLIGKSHRLPIFYAARQHCDPADMNRDKWQTYYWFAENPKEFMEHYLLYREELWNFYQNHVAEQKYSKETFFQIMDIAHAMYFGVGCPPEYFHSVLQNKWPADVYQKSNLFSENVCNHLKSTRRVWLEASIENIIKWMPKILLSYYSLWDMRKLNKKIQRYTKANWKCALARELKWLAGVDSFGHAYQELCLYLGQPQ
ncbi:TIGR00180 family glycosyltransferase [Aquicella lusitana]|uniref:Glycosyltransferase domain-containing protein n=1 Tax=Aquicella lusitana TaxID=254246 RepID=A0A370GXE3_9COXI|nr:TIGR00180 family glycosyltransferase [Aquicella lusitana]RDI48149.1 glycosyltransferase domain-containing protein [Aquicella lusitana]VVC72835.1 hypothetical protein AQULUS_05590 [Aquicella lusitana]